jgi:hypothetical protein
VTSRRRSRPWSDDRGILATRPDPAHGRHHYHLRGGAGGHGVGRGRPDLLRAARTSILRDTIATQPVSGRGYEINETDALPQLRGQLSPTQKEQLDDALGSLAGQGLFGPPVYSLAESLPSPAFNTSIPLIRRTGACAHLRIDGKCPAASGQVVISRSTAKVTAGTSARSSTSRGRFR